MGDTGRETSHPGQEPTPMPRLALYAIAVCVLAVVAAVVSFASGSWVGVVWILLAGVSSNMAWYYVRKQKNDRAAEERRRQAAAG
ncbi:hypothetical protein AB0I49_21625 [Streptomyces sp. NPDC050617]|uniref:hypothetical protein n=1 Tax=Streptomyces sp. NPDC050617 TaxID=3154628 RepID=UPI0034121082